MYSFLSIKEKMLKVSKYLLIQYLCQLKMKLKANIFLNKHFCYFFVSYPQLNFTTSDLINL